MKLEEEKKKRDSSFLGFFVEESNPLKGIYLMIENFKILYGKSVIKIEGQPSKPTVGSQNCRLPNPKNMPKFMISFNTDFGQQTRINPMMN